MEDEIVLLQRHVSEEVVDALFQICVGDDRRVLPTLDSSVLTFDFRLVLPKYQRIINIHGKRPWASVLLVLLQ